MGRGLLITVTLLVALYSLMVITMQERKKELATQNVGEMREIQARNAAYSGIDLAINTLGNNGWDYNNVQPQQQYQIGDVTSSVQIQNPMNASLRYNQLEINSSGKAGPVQKKVSSMLKTNLPTPRAAMAFYGDNDVNFNANGNSFQINGHDQNPDGSSGSAPPVPGVSTQDSNSYQGFESGLKPGQQDNVKGAGGSPSMAVKPEMDPQHLQQQVDRWVQDSDNEVGNEDEQQEINNVQWGDDSDPEVTVVKGDLEMGGTNDGYGMLVVKNSATLTVKGDFNYKGLIVSNGQDMELDARGNTTIHGSVMTLPDSSCGTTQSGCNTSISLSGNIDMHYSRQSLINTQSGLRNKLNVTYTKSSIYD